MNTCPLTLFEGDCNHCRRRKTTHATCKI